MAGVVLANAQAVTAVLNAAAYTSTVAPGIWVAICGTQLAPSALASATAPFPTDLNGVNVKFNGKSAPLSYVSATRINASYPSTRP